MAVSTRIVAMSVCIEIVGGDEILWSGTSRFRIFTAKTCILFTTSKFFGGHLVRILARHVTNLYRRMLPSAAKGVSGAMPPRKGNGAIPMKLTLRTLLAWRDRVLPEQDHNELDQKVAATELAQKLEQKIREVLAKAELPAAQVHGRGLAASANSVAEFLDNALDPELLGPFEKNCVDSDVQLCEVAECHHLLAGMAGQPELTAVLNEEERRRLGEAIKRHSEQLAAETEHAIDVANARAVRAELDAIEQGRGDSVGEPTTGRTPRRRSRGPVVAAAVAVALLMLLVVILGVQLAQSGRTNSEQQLAVRPPVADVVPAAVAEPPVAVVDESASPAAAVGLGEQAAPPAAAVDQPLVVQPEVAEQPEMAVATTSPAEADVADLPATGAPPPPTVASMANRPQVPQGTAMAIAATTPPMTPQPAAAASVAGPNAVAPTTIAAAFPEAEATPPVLGFLDNDAIVGSGFVLHRTSAADPAELDGWQCLPAGSQLSVYDEVLVPPGLSPSFSIGSVQVQMRPRTHAILKIDSAGMPRIELLDGSLIIRSSEKAAELGLTAGGLKGVILSGLLGGIAVDVTRLTDSELAARQTTQALVARMVPLAQPINWRQTQASGLPPRVLLRGLEVAAELQPLELVEWSEMSPLTATRQAITELPDWATPLRRISSLEKDASEALVEAVTRGEPLQKSLIELSVDRRIENRMMAVETLALVGHFDELVELLREPPPNGPAAGRWEQLEGQTVPLAFSDPELAPVLEKAFRDQLEATQALTAIGLARRNLPAPSADDLTRQLIDLLESEELMLRRYAYAWLCERFRLEPMELIQYRADWPAEQLRDGADWWRNRLKKGLLQPQQPGSSEGSGGQ
jgi:hypothetical protein